MFHYLRRDHRGHKDDNDRLNISSPHFTRPRTSRDKTAQQELSAQAPGTSHAVDTSAWTHDVKDNASHTQDSQSPGFLPPLPSLTPLTTPADQGQYGESPSGLMISSRDSQSREPSARSKASSKVVSSLSLSRSVSKKKKQKLPKVDTEAPHASSMSLGPGGAVGSPSAKGDHAPQTASADAKPSSPWRLGFGSSKNKDTSKASATAPMPAGSSNGTASQKTPTSKDTSPDTAHHSSKLTNDSPNSVDGDIASMPAARHSTTKSSHITSYVHLSHDASTKEKRRLNLLNPMTLLSRRRSNQNSATRQENVTLPALPDDYDPRIRGNYVHDFSSPRVRNPPPLNVQRANELTGNGDLATPHAHETSVPLSAQDTSFHCETSQVQEDEQRPTSALPSPVGLTPPELPDSAERADSVSDLPSDVINGRSALVSPSNRSRASSRRSALGLPRHAPSTASRFSFDMGGGEPSAQERLLEEKHKQKEAEDRAKRIEERIKNPHIKRDSESTFDDFGEFDDFDYDAMLDEDDGGYEERIPGVNADPESDNDGFSSPMPNQYGANQRQSVYDENGYSASPYARLASAQMSPEAATTTALFTTVSPIDENDQSVLSEFSLGGMRPGSGLTKQANGSLGDIRDSTGSAVNGFAHFRELSRGSTCDNQNTLAWQTSALNSSEVLAYNQAQQIVQTALQGNGFASPAPAALQRASLSHPVEDDLYFDDGMFGNAPGLGHPSNSDGVPFDENLFDDENSYLYDRKRAARAAALEKAAQAQAQSGLPAVAESPLQDQFKAGFKPEEDDIVQYDPDQFGKRIPLKPHNTINEKTSTNEAAGNGVNAYHVALVEAMQRAALEGRFERPSSASSHEHVDGCRRPQPLNLHPPSASDQFHSEPDDMSSLVDDFEYDNLDDDSENIIAAANAEALENDDDGLYGLEFGFYANAPPNSKAETGEMFYGGYFGERGINMDAFAQGKNGIIHRSHSGRAADYQEPSLTPITERSEWSNRNSLHSLPHHLPVGSTAALPDSLPSSSPLSHMTDAGPRGSESKEAETSLHPHYKSRRDLRVAGNGLHSLHSASTSSVTAILKPRAVSLPVAAGSSQSLQGNARARLSCT